MFKLIKYLLLLAVLFFAPLIKSQTFGFGCLGLVGGYGGYSYQEYKPTGLNNYILVFNELRTDSSVSTMDDFGKTQGYRIGLNFFRANFKGFILTAKGFYQFLSEKHNSSENMSNGISNTSFKLELKNWGLGLDLGTSITSMVSWKVIDAALLFNSATFVNTENLPGARTEIEKYKSGSELGYTVGTGFILALVDDYVTLEGLAAYTVISFEEMKKDDGSFLTINEDPDSGRMTNFIETGGFNAVIQLNVGLPL
jgi:hypothetical protein